MSPVKKPVAIQNDYGRRPEMKSGKDKPDFKGYLKGGGRSGTYREMMSRNSESTILQRQVEEWLAHSEFKKPYYDDEFPEMEHFWSQPVTLPGNEYDPITPGSISECWDVCRKNHSGHYFDDDCYLFIWMHPDLTLTGNKVLVDNDFFKSMTYSHKGPLYGGVGIHYAIYKSDEPITPDASISWHVEQTIFDACPSVSAVIRKSCKKTFIKNDTCGDCPVSPVVAWDYASSVEVIAQSNSDTVAVSGGLGPYTWAISGTGFTLDSAQTSGLTNTINAGGTANGTATITVTDACGDIATGYVRCTTGQWTIFYTQSTGGGEPDVGCYGLDDIIDPTTDLQCSAAPFVVHGGVDFVGIKGKYAIQEYISAANSGGSCVPYNHPYGWTNYSCFGDIGTFGIFGDVYQTNYVGMRCNKPECTWFVSGTRVGLDCCTNAGSYYVAYVDTRYFYVWDLA